MENEKYEMRNGKSLFMTFDVLHTTHDRQAGMPVLLRCGHS